MTGLIVFGIVALVALMGLLMLLSYNRRFAHGGAGDDTLQRSGRWYKVRRPIKQSVLTDTHGDLVHQDGTTTATARGETVEVINKTTGEAYTTKTPDNTFTKQ